MSDLDRLADLIQETGPSRELDIRIATELDIFCPLPATEEDTPTYTSSVDEAMTLSDWRIVHLSEIGADGLPLCVLTNGVRTVTGLCLVSGVSGAMALAPALAAAGVRARAQAFLDEEDGPGDCEDLPPAG